MTIRIAVGSILAALFFPVLAAHALVITPSCDIAVYPATVQPGQPVTVYWTSSDAWQGNIWGMGTVPPNGSRIVIPTASISYYGTFVGSGAAFCSATLTVLPSTISPVQAVQAACTEDGATLLSGESRPFFLTRSSQSCLALSQMRTCSNGTLSGSTMYAYSACATATSSVTTSTPQMQSILEMLGALLVALRQI